VTAVIIVTVTATLIVNEFTGLCPWLATRLVRRSAFRRYSDPARAEVKAEELVALINDCPGNLLKLIIALHFAVAASVSKSTTPSPQFVGVVAATTFRHFAGGIRVNNGNTLTIPNCVLGTHLDDCKACRRRLWLSRPGAMLIHRRSIRWQLVSSERGWSFTAAGLANQTVRPYRDVVTIHTEHDG
jgi:hypothetical protein